MAGIRTALAFATADKYLTSVLGLGTMAIVARFVSPKEFGVAAIGMSTFALAEAMREFGSAAYIVQTRKLTPEGIRAVFTIGLIFTLVLSAAVLVGAPTLARALGISGLDEYLAVAVLGFLAGPVTLPVWGVLARDMQFNRIALVNVTTALVNAAVLISLATLGFSFMSFAWANVCSALVGTTLLLAMRGEAGFYRPTVTGLNKVLAFSGYTGGSAMLQTGAQYAALVMVGTLLSSTAVGLLHRATLLCQFPERVILAGVNAVALPAFSERARRGENLALPYLAAIERLTGLMWPCLGALVLVAHPMVRLVLGEDWMACAPLVQIIAAALLLNFPPGINYPLIISTGRTPRAFWLAMLQVAVTTPVVFIAAGIGVEAVAWSTFLIVGFNVVTSTSAVRGVAPFTLRDLGGAMWRSALAAGMGLGPAVWLVWALGGAEGLSASAAAGVLAVIGAGWLAGLYLVRHPLLGELGRVRQAIARRI